MNTLHNTQHTVKCRLLGSMSLFSLRSATAFFLSSRSLMDLTEQMKTLLYCSVLFSSLEQLENAGCTRNQTLIGRVQDWSESEVGCWNPIRTKSCCDVSSIDSITASTTLPVFSLFSSTSLKTNKFRQYPRRPTQSGTVPLFVEQFHFLWNSSTFCGTASQKCGTAPQKKWNRFCKRVSIQENCGSEGQIGHSKFVGTLQSS